MELEKNKYYRVRVIEDDNEKIIGKKVKVKYTGIFLTGKNEKNKLYLYQVEVLEEITEEEFVND